MAPGMLAIVAPSPDMARPAPRRRAAPLSPAREAATSAPVPVASLRPLVVPLLFSLGLAGFALLPSARTDGTLLITFVGAAAVLLAWCAGLLLAARASGRRFTLDYSARKQHWLQACAHLSIYVYWGWHWRRVYDATHLIASQLVFAYALDALLAFTRRGKHTLTFGPFPIIFSTNLFLWFKPEWFYLQFVMVTVGFLAKEWIRWERDGRPTHVFNPSSFPLALFSVGLLVTGTTDHTWGREIATTLFYPRFIYPFIFLVGLPGQFFFGVTTMTMSAVVTAFGWSALYHALSGSHYFFDSQIPIAVFLGMHLLFTDPSTSPRSEPGRIVFGVLYGASVVFLYWLLGALGVDTFYDKLLPVPLLNLLVRAIDNGARRVAERLPRPAPRGAASSGAGASPRLRNLGYMTVWALVFAGFASTGGLGDTHPGNRYPFWRKACRDGLRHGCDNLGTMVANWCRRDVAWACNELGILIAEKRISVEPTATQMFERACAGGFETACANGRNLERHGDIAALQHRAPRPVDYDVLLDTKGRARADSLQDVFTLACDQGWSDGCVGLAALYLQGREVKRDAARAAALLEPACDGGEPTACSNLGLMYKQGDGVKADRARALALLEKACGMKLREACRWLEEERHAPPAAPGGGQP